MACKKFSQSAKYAAMLMLGCASVAQADVNTKYFIDHAIIQYGKPLTVPYSFPANNYVIQCASDQAGSHLGYISWQYTSYAFTIQMGDLRRLILSTDNPNIPYAYRQTADSQGSLVIANLDSSADLEISCRYHLPSRNELRTK
jgi:hypothetical protein